MSGDPMYRPPYGAIAGAIHLNVHRYYCILALQVFSGAAAEDEYFESLDPLWQRLENDKQSKAYASHSPKQSVNAASVKSASRSNSSVNVKRSPISKDYFVREFDTWPAEDSLFRSVWVVTSQSIGWALPNFVLIDP